MKQASLTNLQNNKNTNKNKKQNDYNNNGKNHSNRCLAIVKQENKFNLNMIQNDRKLLFELSKKDMDFIELCLLFLFNLSKQLVVHYLNLISNYIKNIEAIVNLYNKTRNQMKNEGEERAKSNLSNNINVAKAEQALTKNAVQIEPALNAIESKVSQKNVELLDKNVGINEASSSLVKDNENSKPKEKETESETSTTASPFRIRSKIQVMPKSMIKISQISAAQIKNNQTVIRPNTNTYVNPKINARVHPEPITKPPTPNKLYERLNEQNLKPKDEQVHDNLVNKLKQQRLIKLNEQPQKDYSFKTYISSANDNIKMSYENHLLANDRLRRFNNSSHFNMSHYNNAINMNCYGRAQVVF